MAYNDVYIILLKSIKSLSHYYEGDSLSVSPTENLHYSTYTPFQKKIH